MTEPVADLAAKRAAKRGAASAIVTEDQAALRFAGLHQGRLRFCHDHGAWFEWDGAIWRRNSTGVAFHWARELARELAATEPDKIRYVTSKAAFAASIERFARADPTFAVTASIWDADPFLLGTPAGTVDLRSGTLHPADHRDGITKSVSVAPLATADCPLWLRFLHDATGGDTGMIRFMRQWAGYGLTGDTREHALVFVFGDGGNGKGVFINVLTGIMAAYATTAAMDTFIASQGDRHSTDLAMLRGARLVTASETEEGRQWAEARIKALTGGDPITARFMRKDNFTYRPAFKLTIIGNHKPTLKNVDDAARRRFNLVPFTFKPPRPDPELEHKLKAEWPGILRWMIDGCLDWQRSGGLVRPASIRDATAAYFSEQDVFGAWLAEECDVEPANHYKTETSAVLFTSWQSYARISGESPGTRKTFSEQLLRHGLATHKGAGGVRTYRGVRLKVRPHHDNDR